MVDCNFWHPQHKLNDLTVFHHPMIKHNVFSLLTSAVRRQGEMNHSFPDRALLGCGSSSVLHVSELLSAAEHVLHLIRGIERVHPRRSPR